jgi:predicted transcriptional regulator
MNIIMLKDLPIQNVLTLTQENTLLDAVTALVENNMESVVITNSDYKSFTYLSLTNILNSMAEESWKDIKISRIKTKPLKTIEQDATTIKALLLMDDDEIIGVVDKKENLCGVSSSRDIIFAINYPKEKMSSIPIEDIIPGNNFATADYNDNLQDALYKINTSQTKCLIVHKNDKPYGIITQRDLINILYKNGNLSEEVEKHMNMPLLTIKKEASIVTVFNMMQMYNLQRVTLLSDHGHCVGVITQKMILNTYHKHIIKEECLAILASNESLSKELVKHTTKTHKSQNELQTCTEELPTIKSTLKDYSQLENMSLVNVSHEIKTPLNAIMGYMELLSFTSLDKKQSSYINKTSNSIDYLLHLLNHILDFNKIETGQVNISYAPFDIHALFSDCIDLFQMEAKKKNLLLEYEIETYVPQYFYGDSYRIRQVVINILSNAIKFTEEGSIFLNVIANENENSTYNVEFVISDTGIGISK